MAKRPDMDRADVADVADMADMADVADVADEPVLYDNCLHGDLDPHQRGRLMWAFDPPTGTWRDEDLSARLLLQAEQDTGLEARLHEYTKGLGERPEYGVAISDFDHPKAESRLIYYIGRILNRTTEFTLLPHLRRVDASYWSCSCGESLQPPTDFGRRSLLPAHRDHDKVWVCKVGPSTAVYAIGAQPDPLLLGEIVEEALVG